MKLRIEELLEAKGKTLYWLKKETGIGYTTLLRYRDGETTGVRFEHVELLCEKIGCDPNTLFGIGKQMKVK